MGSGGDSLEKWATDDEKKNCGEEREERRRESSKCADSCKAMSGRERREEGERQHQTLSLLFRFAMLLVSKAALDAPFQSRLLGNLTLP